MTDDQLLPYKFQDDPHHPLDPDPAFDEGADPAMLIQKAKDETRQAPSVD